jgi:hypothetical protein
MGSARISRRDLLRRGALTGAALTAGSLLGGVKPVFGATPGIPVVADNLSFARVWPRTARELAAMSSFDDTHMLFGDGSLELLLWPGDRRKLDALGVDYQLWSPQRENAGARRSFLDLPLQPGERSDYRVYANYITDIQALATDNPQQAAAFKFAEKSLEGRDMWGIEIADDIAAARTDGRPTFWIDGTHHSREWPSTEYTMMFAFDLLESFKAGDPRIGELMTKLRFVVVPVVNPDGFVTSREAVLANTPADMDAGWANAGQQMGWRKNRRSYTDALYPAGNVRSELNADAHGVDPNRNYAFYWGGEGGGNTDPQSQTYAGKTPFSEPEARNISGVMKSLQMTAYLTNHTSGQLCMRPWGFTTDPSADHDYQEELGARMCEFHGYRNQLAIGLYPTAGTSRDWAYASQRTIVYTFEHNREFHPDYGPNIPSTYAINRPAWLLLAEAAADPANHLVLTGRVVNASGAPVGGQDVTLSKEFNTPTHVEVKAVEPNQGVAESITTVHPTRADGTFEIHANPSTRPLNLYFDETAKEFWTVTIGGTTREVYGDRGDRVDLGTITI